MGVSVQTVRAAFRTPEVRKAGASELCWNLFYCAKIFISATSAIPPPKRY